MFTVKSEMHFHEPPEVVFDFLSDDRNELLWEPPNVSSIEKTSPGPVDAGTTFVGNYAPRDYRMEVRIVEYDRPHRVVRDTRGKYLWIYIELDFSPENGGTRAAASWTVRPRGWMRLLEPLLRRAFWGSVSEREKQIAKGLAKRAPSPA
jgi:Polyketide cyclase / dehydrase and lipid transport